MSDEALARASVTGLQATGPASPAFFMMGSSWASCSPDVARGGPLGGARAARSSNGPWGCARRLKKVQKNKQKVAAAQEALAAANGDANGKVRRRTAVGWLTCRVVALRVGTWLTWLPLPCHPQDQRLPDGLGLPPLKADPGAAAASSLLNEKDEDLIF